jgi:hypothetical protein
MLTQREFAQLIDGPAVEAEMDRLVRLGADGIDMATRLNRRVQRTVDWQPLGPEGARLRHMTSRGESVVFWDDEKANQVIKMRGMPENGFETTGFGCVLGTNKQGLVDLQAGTLAQAIVRESICWELFGFGCHVEDIVGEDAALLLSQQWIKPAEHISSSTIEHRIQNWMIQQGWKSLSENQNISPLICNHGWHRDGIGAFDVNETNFIISAENGEIYPIDLIVWPLPSF